MQPDLSSPTVVVVAGPQASGKSTLAAALAADLRGAGERVALVELDQVAAMALPTLPGWDEAHRIFSTLVGLWARADMTCVVAEGSGSAEELAELVAGVPPRSTVVVVATTTTYEVALRRAEADPTRGVSKDPAFLRGAYDAWPAVMAAMAPGTVVDTTGSTVAGDVARVRAEIDGARAPGRPTAGSNLPPTSGS